MSYQFGKQKEKIQVYFNVPYFEREQAKKLGFRWDATNSSWYKNLDLSDIKPVEFLPFKPSKELNIDKVYELVNPYWIQYGWETVKNKNK